MNKRFGILLTFVIVQVVISGTVPAGENSKTSKIELLWPDGAPGAKGTEDKDKPALTICLPEKDKANGTAIVICPGGGYQDLAMDHEGAQIADWLNLNGIAAFILSYRYHGRGYSFPAPMQDAQRAMRIVRSRADEWNIDSKRIGILGFSAGGHLASSIGTHFKTNYYEAKDNLDKVSCRPDFMILAYPVITMDNSYTHRGSRINLLGRDADPNLVELYSNEKQVTSETPPAFLVHSNEDGAVPVENSVNFYLALRKARVPAEMHIYLKGGHGTGIEKRHGVISTWSERCIDWMTLSGLMDKQNN
ncbi:MAG: alpha/beta hydrolase [Sedimentisphaerales bacterium]|nr:alpha/beta hydrolase [Sedimentisphaerales bacterium]